LHSLGENVRVVVRNFVPVFVSRGVVQLSATVDTIIASFLPTSAVAALSSAQTIYLLPVSLFGMSVSVAELPAMSRTLGDEDEVAAALRQRIAASTRRIAFFVVPSAVAFLALGDVVAGAIYQRGHFSRANTLYVWAILAGSAVGLVAQTVGRLYASAYWALRDTRTPLRFAVVRVIMTTVLGYLFALPLPRLAGIDPRYGAVGLSATAGFAAWLEFLLLRRGMNRRIGKIDASLGYFLRLWIAAGLAAAMAWGIRLVAHTQRPIVTAVLVLIPYGLAYLVLTTMLGINQAGTLVKRFARAAARLWP
jgi:putative peptidoglycan lipid II flippase